MCKSVTVGMVASKYLVNGFPYLGKDETRPAGLRLADHVVMKLMERTLEKDET